ncbi:pol polyprotein-like protein [Dinothrombium tinctorium]|uniref:Pol polyprotein-like protein n=3 Tax=Dinothrombium tinctorium TaxID=1965070 RepID=A0A443QAM1_9ACAR|nr:pol polyprotein-like protein [Dinothrombium tinctorium]
MGPFTPTERGNKYIVTAIDQLTKYVEMRAIPSQDAIQIGKFINCEIMNRHGPPMYLMSDKGRVFISEIVQAIVAINPPTIQQFTSGYHPKSNGNVERVQGTLKNVLRTFCHENDEDWDLFVDAAKFSYNTKISETTGFSPYELLFNRKPLSIYDQNLEPEVHLHENPFGVKAKERWKTQIALAKERILKKQMQSMLRFNENHRQQFFVIGDLVMLRNRHFDLDRSQKLQATYEGPYLVINRLSPCLYTIQQIDNVNNRKNVNVELLEPYQIRNEEFVFENSFREPDINAEKSLANMLCTKKHRSVFLCILILLDNVFLCHSNFHPVSPLVWEQTDEYPITGSTELFINIKFINPCYVFADPTLGDMEIANNLNNWCRLLYQQEIIQNLNSFCPETEFKDVNEYPKIRQKRFIILGSIIVASVAIFGLAVYASFKASKNRVEIQSLKSQLTKLTKEAENNAKNIAQIRKDMEIMVDDIQKLTKVVEKVIKNHIDLRTLVNRGLVLVSRISSHFELAKLANYVVKPPILIKLNIETMNKL